MQKCPICNKTMKLKGDMLDHIDNKHALQIPEDMSTAQFLYYSRTGNRNGRCMVCSKDTEFNHDSGKPYKLCSDTSCRQSLRKEAVDNHMNAYGVDTFLRDPNYQKDKMLKNRSSNKQYTLSDGEVIDYMSGLEFGFVKFSDHVLGWTSKDLVECPYIFTYNDNGVERSYIPDYFNPTIDLIIEIKEGTNTNEAYLKETKYKEALKEEAVRKDGRFHYIKIVDNNFTPLLKLLYKLKEDDIVKSGKKKTYFINESIQPNLLPDFTSYPVHLMLVHGKYSEGVETLAISDCSDLHRVYAVNGNKIIPTSKNHSMFNGKSITNLIYTGIENEKILKFFSGSEIDIPDGVDGLVYLLEILASLNVNVDLSAYGSSITNNEYYLSDFTLHHSICSIDEVRKQKVELINESLSPNALMNKLNSIISI